MDAIRKGMPVQKAASEFGIPSGTLYGRCKKVGTETKTYTSNTVGCTNVAKYPSHVSISTKVGIELSKTAAVHWSDDDMKKALDSVRSGGMSINQVHGKAIFFSNGYKWFRSYKYQCQSTRY